MSRRLRGADRVLQPGVPRGDRVPDPGVPREDLVLDPGVPRADRVPDPGVPREDRVLHPGLQRERQVLDPGLQREDRVLDPGLQRERTSLAWSRTGLVMLGNAVLVLVRHDRSFPTPVSAALAGWAALTAAAAFVLGVRRSRIQTLPDRLVGVATADAVVVAGLLVVLCAGTLAAIVFTG